MFRLRADVVSLADLPDGRRIGMAFAVHMPFSSADVSGASSRVQSDFGPMRP